MLIAMQCIVRLAQVVDYCAYGRRFNHIGQPIRVLALIYRAGVETCIRPTAQRAMKLMCARKSRQRGGVLYAEAAPHGDSDSILCLSNQRAQRGCGVYEVSVAARREDSVCAGCNDIFECFTQGRCNVKGAMEGYLHRRGQGDELTGRLYIDAPVLLEKSEDDSGCTELPGVQDVIGDDVQLGLSVEKVSAPWTDEDVDGELAVLDCALKEGVAGSESAFAEGGAEFDAVGTAIASCKAGSQGLGAEFKDDLVHRSDLGAKAG